MSLQLGASQVAEELRDPRPEIFSMCEYGHMLAALDSEDSRPEYLRPIRRRKGRWG